MFGWTTGAANALRALLVAAAVAAGGVACATSPGADPAPAAEADVPQADRVLSDVWVEKDGDASRVILVGPADPVYTAFLREEPAAVVVDVAGVVSREDLQPVSVFDGLVEQVSVSSFDEGGEDATTRVEVLLSQDATYEVEPSDLGLALRVSPVETGPEVAETGGPAPASPAAADPWETADGLDEAPAEEGEAPAAAEPAAPAGPATPASRLSDIAVTSTDDGVLVHLVADGVVGSAESFVLEDPDRLVLDLPGLTNSASPARRAVEGERVARVRVGAHPDKVRVVIDGGPGAGGFEGRRVVPARDGLVVALGGGEALDRALASATAMPAPGPDAAAQTADGAEPASEPLEAEGEALAEAPESPGEAGEPEVQEPQEPVLEGAAVLARVHGIHFDSQPERDRIVVLSEGLVEYETHFPDPETLVLSIADAEIPRDAEGRITPQPGGPVSLVTAFQQPDVDQPEVRIVVKRAPDLAPEISRRGEILFVDFPNEGVAAAAPPAFPGAQPVLSTGGSSQPEAEGTAAVSEVGTRDGMEPAPEGTAAAEPTDIAGLPQFSEEATLDAPLAGAGSAPAAPAGEAGPASLEPPAAVDLLQEGGLIDGKEYEGRRISLDFKDVEIADVLRIIAEVSDLNIVAGEEVDGTVTIRLVDVPWDQALDVILLTKGLGFVRVGNVLRIAPADVLAQEEEVRLQERRNKEKLEDLTVKLHPVNYANVEDVSGLVKRLLSPRGTVNVDERTNTLIIKDIASVIDEATALINAVDTQTPQVMIEAKIVEANLDFSRELGTVWSVGTQALEDGFDDSSDPRRDLGGEDFQFHDDNNVIFANPITSLANGLVNLNAFLLDQQIDLGVQLQAAEAQGDGKVISSPRIVTLDNREAEILQGVSIPFQTFENGDAQLEFIDAVLRLLVTPHITADKSIIMKVEVERNAPDDTVPTPTGSPAIAKNEAKTETLVKDGQTLVIGGIYTVTKTRRESRVPYLSSIPILGNAFRSREVSDQRKELLIFVTPRVVVQPNA